MIENLKKIIEKLSLSENLTYRPPLSIESVFTLVCVFVYGTGSTALSTFFPPCLCLAYLADYLYSNVCLCVVFSLSISTSYMQSDFCWATFYSHIAMCDRKPHWKSDQICRKLKTIENDCITNSIFVFTISWQDLRLSHKRVRIVLLKIRKRRLLE